MIEAIYCFLLARSHLSGYRMEEKPDLGSYGENNTS
jgi:hypothetical protein